MIRPIVGAVGVGFVGLGDIGAPMARRLAERLRVQVWARRREATTGFVEVAPRLEDLARCELVGVCVTDDAALREVVERLVPVLGPGTLVCVHSTVRPDTVRALAERVDAVGAGLVDAPVSGGSDRAARGELLVFVGGRPDHVEQCAPVLEVLGSLHVIGEVGAGQTVKILNNALYAAHAALGACALDLGQELGLLRPGLVGALVRGSGSSFALERLDRLHDPARSDHFAQLLDKDLDLFDAMTGETGRPISSVARLLINRLRSVAHA